MAPTISILLTTRNRRATLRQAVDSVRAQTFTDWELVIVDDASSDGTEALLAEYAQADRRIRTLRNNPWRGRVRSLNRALGHACGSLIAFIDDDDVWRDREKLVRQRAFLEQHPDCVLVGTWALRMDANGSTVKELPKAVDDQTIRRRLLRTNQFAQPAALCRREAIERAGGWYDETLRYTEDFDLWLRLGRVGTLANLPAFMLGNRVTGQNVSVRKRQPQLLEHLRLILRYRHAYPGAWSALCVNALKLMLNALLRRPRY